MASQSTDTLDVSGIISGTIETVQVNSQAALTFFVVVAGLGTVADILSTSGSTGLMVVGGLLQLVVLVVSIIAGYRLLEAMLEQSGLLSSGVERRYWPFVGQAIVMGLAISLGFVLLIIPGLIVAARWSIAQALLVGRGENVFDAMRASWEATSGHTVTIILAALVLFIVFAVIVGLGMFVFGETTLIGILLSQAGGTAMSVLSFAFATYLLGRLAPGAAGVRQVFG